MNEQEYNERIRKIRRDRRETKLNGKEESIKKDGVEELIGS